MTNFRFYDEPMKSDLERIYAEYTPGSLGFAREVFSHCGYGMTVERIQKLSLQAKTAEEFHDLWENGPRAA
jgi:hypothetical protein